MIIYDGFNHMNSLLGTPIRIRYYSETIGSVWDDERSLTQSGTDLYVTGLIAHIDRTKGSTDEVLLEQGRIRYNDSKLFLAGSVQTTSGIRVFTMSVSGNDDVYREIQEGVFQPAISNTTPMKKVYVRLIPLGSLF